MKKYPIKIYSHDYDNVIKLNVYCTDKCNYKCSYCYNMKSRYARLNIDLDLTKVYNFACWLNEKTGKNIIILLIGGEPTMHPNFIEFSRMTNEKNFIVYSFSNFSNTFQFYEETIKNNIKFLITYHHTTKERYLEFLTKLRLLNEKNLDYGIDTINVMLLGNTFQTCLAVYDELFAIYKSKVLCNLIDDCDKANIDVMRQTKYTKSQLNEYDERCKHSNLQKDNIVTYNDNSVEYLNDYEIKNSTNFNFKLWKCDAGKTYFNIDMYGNITPCDQHLTKKLATLDTFHTLNFKETICLTTLCPCEYGLGKQKIFNVKNS